MSKSTSTAFKEAFKGTWAASAKKEGFVKNQIERFTDLTVLEKGFGAGETGYIEGASGEHGFDKAAPDLEIKGTNIVIEVTGPLRAIQMGSSLLINITKVQYALDHPEKEYWMGWLNGVVSRRSQTRFVRIGKKFREGIVAGVIIREQFETRGMQQFFFSIPFNHTSVCTFDRFIQYLNDTASN